MKLISTTDFILEQAKNIIKYNDYTNDQILLSIVVYANFLKQPLKLEMFIPCDENDKLMIEPNNSMDDKKYFEKYQQAEEKVIFNGFKIVYCRKGKISCIESISKNVFLVIKYLKNKTIEDLVGLDLECEINF